MISSARIGFLHRPWIRVKRESHPEASFVFEKINYNIYANLGLKVRSTKRFVVTLDTGAGSRFIRLKEIKQVTGHKICNLCNVTNIRNTGGNSVLIFGTIYLMVQIGTSTELFTSLSLTYWQPSSYFGVTFAIYMWNQSNPDRPS